MDLYGSPMEEIIRRGDYKAQLQTIDYLIQRVRGSARNPALCAMLDSIDVRSRYQAGRLMQRELSDPSLLPRS